MDDLLGVKFNEKPTGKTQPNGPSLSNFAALRPTPPISGRSTPLLKVSSNASSRTQTPANDSFSNLVSFGSGPSNKGLSLEEQLKEKTKIEAANQKQAQSGYTAGDEQFWDKLGGGQTGPASQQGQLAQPTSNSYPDTYSNHIIPSNQSNRQSVADDEDDILAAFNADAPVDSSSHFPKPFESRSRPKSSHQKDSSGKSDSRAIGQSEVKIKSNIVDDDDPFGLGQLPQQRTKTPSYIAAHDDDDDILGFLGKPTPKVSSGITGEGSSADKSSTQSQPQDKALAELMEMGFSIERAREALERTDSGSDVPQAVGWLLAKAHADAKQGPRERQSGRPGHREDRARNIDRKSTPRSHLDNPDTRLAWAKKEPSPSRFNQSSSDRSESVERDPAQMASEFGTTFLKTAGSLWKTSTKKMQQAVQDLNSDSDSSQPRWMREPGTTKTSPPPSDFATPGRNGDRPRRKSSTSRKGVSVTDEALMLESDGGRPPPRKGPRRHEPGMSSSADNSRDHSPAVPSSLRQDAQSQPAFLRQQTKHDRRPDPKRLLSRDVIEEQASQAYTSSARRRKPPPRLPVLTSKPDLLESKSHPTNSTLPASIQLPKRVLPSPSSTPIVVRSAAPIRQIPSVSQISLKASHVAREAGNDHYKRGDYSAAQQSYTSSLKHIPSTHPISLILLTNRALTSLKIGEAKSAIADADTAMALIGPSRGESESIDLTNGEPQKPMRDYLGKALMRKAEALEQLEKWTEAAALWKDAVKGGHGGVLSVQGKTRCEKASMPKPPKPQQMTKKVTQPPRRPLNGTNRGTSSAVAVASLRAANAAAERADDEKFALTDTVNAKLEKWKGTKVDNLRALLGSLDTVLWPEAGWKKIGMAELILPGKVKVHYMKGIAKVHPDKIPTTATTEQRMIAGAVFSTLNEAWDKFKAENGL